MIVILLENDTINSGKLYLSIDLMTNHVDSVELGDKGVVLHYFYQFPALCH